MYREKEKGNNFSDLMRDNRALVAKLIMRNGECSRSQLSTMTGLTQASITNIVSDLIQLGIVTESGTGERGKGRRPIMLRIKEDSYFVIGAKLSRRHFELGVMDLAGHIVESKRTPILEEDHPLDVLNMMRNSIQALYEKHGRIIAVGVSVPGPYLRYQGRIAKMTETHGWEAVNIERELETDIGVPLFIEHDANAGALAEWWFGGHNSRFLVHMLVGEGVGAGIVYEGRLLLGSTGVAGEIGHMTIEFTGRNCQCAPMARGCLEQYASSISFLRDVLEELPMHPDSTLNQCKRWSVEAVFKAAIEHHDAYACDMIRKVGFYLGVGIANVINIYNPDMIVISDIMAQGGELLLNSIRETVSSRVIPELFESTRICLSGLPYNTSLFGAAAVAVDHFLMNPIEYVHSKLGQKI